MLDRIQDELFYSSSDYTKSQPDLFIPHRFKMLAPSQVNDFLVNLKDNIACEEEILLYVHLPFCFSECLFCNSFPHRVDKKIQQDYLENLLREIEIISESGLFEDKKAKGIYFGGGTPTSFSNADLGRIIERLSTSIDFSKNCNITSEAHPATLIDKSRVEGMAAIGINRISIGCQTFDPEILKLCNRQNTEAQIKKVVGNVRDTGIFINIDMMSGLPGQTIASINNDRRILEETKPDAVEYIRHEIVNPLVIELYKKRPDLIVDKATLFQMVLETQQWMVSHGYEQNGRFSNDTQWAYRYHWLKEMPIIAFGSRARSYTRTICYDKHEELSTCSLMVRKGLPPIGRYINLTERERMYRTFFLQLQLKEGVNISDFVSRYGKNPVEQFKHLIAKLTDLSCLKVEADSIRLTHYGEIFIEDVCDSIIDAALREDSEKLVRAPHSEGSTSSRFSAIAN